MDNKSHNLITYLYFWSIDNELKATEKGERVLLSFGDHLENLVILKILNWQKFTKFLVVDSFVNKYKTLSENIVF
ncbi:MAG: hypothetical protein ACP8RL_03005 [cyanobacterium endosymbiont of Rhopalodia inflata]